jgi:cell division protein ZapA
MGRKQHRASRLAPRAPLSADCGARSADRGKRVYNAPGFKFFPMDGKNDSISVEIFGQTYNVRGEGDPDYLTELARFVDSRMREVAAQVATVDPVKIAILAALNIADEFSRYRKQRLGAWIEKTEELSNRLNKVIS